MRNGKFKESLLRDYLADHPELIESGLTVIQKEYKLFNKRGTRGSIDILARDKYQLYVIIEIKKSNTTAREALHELHKYAELIQDNFGLGSSQLRCILVSTHWDELRVPFAAFVRHASYQVEGYEAVVGTNQIIDSLRPVHSYAAPTPMSPFRQHLACLFSKKSTRGKYISQLSKKIASSGVTSAALIVMRAKPGRPQVVYPFAAYVAVMDISTDAAKKAKRAIKKSRDVILDLKDSIESHILELVLDKVGHPETMETAWPERFLAEQDNWKVEEIVRVGKLSKSHLISDQDMIRAVSGLGGTGRILCKETANTKFGVAWKATKSRALSCLEGNPWQNIAKFHFKSLERVAGGFEVKVQIYTPADLVMMFYQLLRRNETGGYPGMEILATNKKGELHSLLSGVVVWDGKTFPKDPEKLLASLFEGDAFNYFLARTCGEISFFEQKLMKAHGLSYATTLWKAGSKDGNWVSVKGKRLVMRDFADTPPQPFHRFIEENEEYLRQLISWFESNAYFARA